MEMAKVRSGFQQIKVRDPVPRIDGDPSNATTAEMIRLWAPPDGGDGNDGGPHSGGGSGSSGGGSVISGGSHVSGSGDPPDPSGVDDGSAVSGDGSGGESGTTVSGWGSAFAAGSGTIIPDGCLECHLTICGNGALIGCKNTRCPGTNGDGVLICCATDRICSTGQTLITGIVTSGMPPGGMGSDPVDPNDICHGCPCPPLPPTEACLPFNIICCYDDCSWLAYFGGYCCTCS